jgi:hypothetical protein
LRAADAGFNRLRIKATNNLILRRKQAPKNLHLLENTECRSFAPKAGLRMTGLAGLFGQLVEPGATFEIGAVPAKFQGVETAGGGSESSGEK